MAGLPELSQFDMEIYQIETEDPVLGGVNGIANKAAKALANRTKFLKDADAAHAAAVDPHPQYMTAAESNAAIAAAVAALVNGSPGALDTLNELAAALGNDANFATSITNALALKAPLASPALTGTPTAPTPATTDSSTKLATTEFVKNAINGGDHKDSVRFTTTANIVLTGLGTQAGGDWPATLTAGDRILAKNQTAGLESGIYIAAAGVWPRATDADTGAELNSGTIIPVESGTINADTNWQLTTDGVVTIGTTALTFAQLPSQFATSAEAQGLALLTKALSPGGLNAAFQGANQNIGANGYQKLPGGLIFQWTQATTNASGTTSGTWPIAFPNAALKAICIGTVGASSNTVAAATFQNLSTTAFTAWTSIASINTVWLFAIGF